jgi:hypothetical protein
MKVGLPAKRRRDHFAMGQVVGADGACCAWAHHLGDLFLEDLQDHGQANSDRERQQTLPGGFGQASMAVSKSAVLAN